MWYITKINIIHTKGNCKGHMCSDVYVSVHKFEHTCTMYTCVHVLCICVCVCVCIKLCVCMCDNIHKLKPETNKQTVSPLNI